MKKFIAVIYLASSLITSAVAGTQLTKDKEREKFVSKLISHHSLEPGGWYWGNSLMFFAVGAGQNPNSDNIQPLLQLRDVPPLGLPARHEGDYLISFDDGTVLPLDLPKALKNRPELNSGLEIYRSIEISPSMKIDLYFCGGGCAERQIYINGIKIFAKELSLFLWGKQYEISKIIIAPDLRRRAFPVVFSAIDKNKKILWERIYLLKTVGALQDVRGNNLEEDVVVTANEIISSMPNGKFFFLGTQGSSEVRFSSLIQKIDVVSGIPYKKNSQLIPVVVSEFNEILQKISTSIERHFECEYSADLEGCRFIPQQEDMASSYKWNGYIDQDLAELLNFEIKQRWYKND